MAYSHEIYPSHKWWPFEEKSTTINEQDIADMISSDCWKGVLHTAQGIETVLFDSRIERANPNIPESLDRASNATVMRVIAGVPEKGTLILTMFCEGGYLVHATRVGGSFSCRVFATEHYLKDIPDNRIPASSCACTK